MPPSSARPPVDAPIGTRPRRVMLAWEQGRGFGHTTRLRVLAEPLMARGIEVVAVVRDLALARPLRDAGVRLIEGPPWAPPAPQPGDDVPASATITDALAAFGLRDPDSVRPVLARWRALLTAERPDLVVCDYAPLATCAARGFAPILQTGSAVFMPPAHLERMPLLHDFAPPRHGDAALCDTLNRCLRAEGLPPLDRIGDLFGGSACFVASFPLLDPYVDLRGRDADGPLLTGDWQPQQPTAAGIFAYLHPDVASLPQVLAMLRALGPRLEMHIPLVRAPLQAALEEAGARVHVQPVAIGPTLARARMILHQGNAGVATDALLAGIPQFSMGQHIEHHLNGSALTAAGVGRHVNLFDPACRISADDVLTVLHDDDMALLAGAAATMHRPLLNPSPRARLLATCLALL
ncbi:MULTISPECIES: hypothetical protein [unclassified Xanthobacter]|uniref:hypothetical protein n=1 Tax=unclassified Xanthobacter TaxID=2623496 RepID=UPI001EE0860D|nr:MULTISPECIES: hypothetical protein [unclassified Xanthobacter]